MATQKKFLESIFAFTGVYMICDHDKFKVRGKMTVKIGFAEDFHDRFGNYLICYPEGIHIFHLFLNANVANARTLERNIHRYLNVKNKFLRVKHSHSEESFSLTNKEVSELIDVVQTNQLTKFTDKEMVNGKNQQGKLIFPYIDDKRGINLFENLAGGGTRVKPMTVKLKAILDENTSQKKKIATSVKKTKYKSIKLPKKFVKISSFND
jgi:hypothetical protein